MAILNPTSELTAQRTDIAVFMLVESTTTSGTTTETWTRCGVAWQTFTENPNAQSKTRKFISESTERKNITRYSPSWAFEVLLMYERPEIKLIYDKIKNRATGTNILVTFAVVDLFDPVEGQDSVYSARRVNASVEVSNLDDDDDMIIKGNFNNQGDEIIGTFDVSAGEFTAAA